MAAVTTYTEYLEREHAFFVGVQIRYDDANTEHDECIDDAQKKHDQTMQMLATVNPTTAAEAQALADAKQAADDLLIEEKAECDNQRADKIEAASNMYQQDLEDLQKEAAESLARVERLIITHAELQPAAIALQNINWYTNSTVATRAPILTVSSLDDLRHELEADRGMFELLLLVRAEDGELVFGTDRRKLSDITSDVQSSSEKLTVLETVHLRGELVGAAPDDTDSLSILGTSNILANWSVQVSPVDVEIEVNGTPPGQLAVVLAKCAHPSSKAVPCRIKLKSGPSPVTVVLHDPNNRLRFPDAADTTVTLQQAGVFVPFEISGHRPSKAVGDAVIEARVVGPAGPPCGTQKVTVVSFTNAEMDITLPQLGGNYGWDSNNRTYLAAGEAMSFRASATIQPPGLVCAVSPLASLAVGIMQEVSYTKITAIYDSPEFDRSAPPPAGTKCSVAKSVRFTITADPLLAHLPVNDGLHKTDYPLYDKGALMVPLGCPNGADAFSSDNPPIFAPERWSQKVPIPSGGVFKVLWTRRKVKRRDTFRTFCVIFDTSKPPGADGQFCALKQAVWDLDVDDSRATDQHATVTKNNRPATADPAAGGLQMSAVQKKTPEFSVAHKTIKWPP